MFLDCNFLLPQLRLAHLPPKFLSGTLHFLKIFILFGRPYCCRKLTLLLSAISIAKSSQLGVEQHGPSSSHVGVCMTAWSCTGLVQVPQLLWLHMCNVPVISRKHYFEAVLPSLWFLGSFHPLFDDVLWVFVEKDTSSSFSLSFGVVAVSWDKFFKAELTSLSVLLKRIRVKSLVMKNPVFIVL